MQFPLVSVLIPCYNHENYVVECIKSIVSQDYPNFELTVIDDGSKDKSPELIKQLAEEYNFTYEIQSNIGLTSTLNKLVKKYGKGKYIIQLASDDIMYPNRIMAQVKFMEENPQYGMSYSKAKIIDENSNIIGESNVVRKSGWVFEDLFLAKFNMPAYTCIYKTEVFEKVGYYDPNAFIEDSDIYYKITRLYQVAYLDIFSAYYRRHGSNMSKRYIELYNDTIRRINLYKEEPKYNEAIYNAKKHWFFLFSTHDKRKALSLFPSVCKKPFNKFFVAGVLNLIGFKIKPKYG